VVTDYFGDDGRPVTVSMARFMGLPESVETVNRLFGLFLKTGPCLLGAGVLLILFAGIRLVFFSPAKSLDPAVSGLTAAGIFLFICFILAHGLLMMDTGFLRSVTLTLSGHGTMAGAVIGNDCRSRLFLSGSHPGLSPGGLFWITRLRRRHGDHGHPFMDTSAFQQ
jgi:hypothetical protein